MITITGYKWVPDFAQGLVRDLRVRWALEEAGLPYRVRLLEHGEQASEGHKALQPFGQVPTYEENGLVLFESGAILQHIAQRSEALMPADADGRARVAVWLFAALNSVEPACMNLAEIDFFCPEEQWAKLHRAGAVEAVQAKLTALDTWLDGREYLEDRFTVADLLMTTVLGILRHTNLVAQRPTLEAYRQRCEARPAFQKALADHLAVFAGQDEPPMPAQA